MENRARATMENRARATMENRARGTMEKRARGTMEKRARGTMEKGARRDYGERCWRDDGGLSSDRSREAVGRVNTRDKAEVHKKNGLNSDWTPLRAIISDKKFRRKSVH